MFPFASVVGRAIFAAAAVVAAEEEAVVSEEEKWCLRAANPATSSFEHIQLHTAKQPLRQGRQEHQGKFPEVYFPYFFRTIPTLHILEISKFC